MKTIVELEADDALHEYDKSVRIANRVIVENPKNQSRRILEECHDKGKVAFHRAMEAAHADHLSPETRDEYRMQANSIALIESEPREEFKWEPK